MRVTDIVFVSMPWAALQRTPIQLGILCPIAQRAGFTAETRHFNLTSMEYFWSKTAGEAEHDRITFPDYVMISEEYYEMGLGEWIFAVPPYRPYDRESDEEYFAYLQMKGVPEKALAKAAHMRALVPGFMDRCVEDILSACPKMLGVTTCFSQNVPSLLLSKIVKERDPSIHVVFGGSNCDGPMGAAIHRLFPWVDTVVRGEAEVVLPSLMDDVLSGRTIRPQPGLCYRDGKDSIIAEEARVEAEPLYVSPEPNYDQYFERIHQSTLASEIMPRVVVLFESARGCWWGEKMHCTFCGLNGSSMSFRSKSASNVAQEIFNLASKYGCTNFQAVDNIIDMKYINELLIGFTEFATLEVDPLGGGNG